jgi:hypothetical protein
MLLVMFITVKRICEIDAPLDMVADSAADWTHFTHIHRKSHKQFRLLSKDGPREIFLYEARMLYPLPFFRTFIAFREYKPEQKGYVQYYLHPKTGVVHYLTTKTISEEGVTKVIGEFSFEVSRFWKFFPRLFIRLLSFRMREVKEEDDEWIETRLEEGVFENKSCLPEIPERFNLMDEFLRDGIKPSEMTLIDHVPLRKRRR